MTRLSLKILWFLAFCSWPTSSFSQALPEGQEVLRSALASIAEYKSTFRNLIATETRQFKIFDTDGRLKKQRVVRSTFIVFPLNEQPGLTEEFRQIIEVDNRAVGNVEKRAEIFFEKIARSRNDAELRQRIRDESFRFDPVEIIGYTTSPGLCLLGNVQNAFRFSTFSEENLDGHLTLRVDCDQAAPTDSIRLSKSEVLPDSRAAADIDAGGDFKNAGDLRMRASLWVDRETFRLRREIREFSVLNYKTQKRIVIQRAEFIFRDSAFGILTPQRILIDLFRLRRRNSEMYRDTRIEIDYSEFSKPEVEVESKSP
jgi:hypothetical protein